MRIAILRKKYTFHGGAESFSGSFIEQLAAEGHEVHIFAIQWQDDGARKNIFFHKVPAVTFNSFFRDLTFALFSSFMLKRDGRNYDIVQTHDKTLYQDIYRAGDGCHIEWLRQRWKRSTLPGKLSVVLNPYHWLILAIERSIFRGRRYKKIIAISKLVKKNIIENYRVPADDIEVIYNAVDLVKFHPGNRTRYRSATREMYGLKESDFVILFVGSGFERKGVRYLIEAVQSLTEPVTLLVVGKGSEKIAARTASGRSSPGGGMPPGRVIFCGPQKDIERYYAAADLFVFPTIYEPFGNVHLEALASGLPVITTASSGAAEIITSGVQGYVIASPEDAAAVSGIIRELYGDRGKLDQMGRDARSLAEEFTFERHIHQIRALYEGVMSCSRYRSS